jgi:two-component system response regulator RegX3
MTGTGTRILIVDDEPSLLRMMSIYLGRMGYSVTVAQDLVKARAEVAASGFAIVVLDATITENAVTEFGGSVLAAEAGRLIVASGYPVDMSGLEAIAPGRTAFLHKPFSPEMLAAAVRRMLGPQENI